MTNSDFHRSAGSCELDERLQKRAQFHVRNCNGGLSYFSDNDAQLMKDAADTIKALKEANNTWVDLHGPAPLMPTDAQSAQVSRELEFEYCNWEGRKSIRRARPISVRFGKSEWHPKPQWLMLALDLDKGQEREFAMNDMEFIDEFPSGVLPLAAQPPAAPVETDQGIGNIAKDCREAAEVWRTKISRDASPETVALVYERIAQSLEVLAVQRSSAATEDAFWDEMNTKIDRNERVAIDNERLRKEQRDPIVWIAFADNGNVRFWTSDQQRADDQKRRGLDLRAFTLAELVALVSRIPVEPQRGQD